MILAEDEVGLGADHAGIMLLAGRTEPGTPLADVLPLADDVLLVESTGNRPDLHSVYGLAREIAALYDLPLRGHARGQSPGHGPGGAGRRSRSRTSRAARATSGACSRTSRSRRRRCGCARGSYARRAAPDLERRRRHELRDARARQPAARLRLHRRSTAADRRPPRARRARRLRTLDGVDRELDPDDLVIADADRAIALAGIMGGEETEIGDGTTTVLLEAANFEPYGIYRTSERQRLRTEGSNRWEKGVDPLPRRARGRPRDRAAPRARRRRAGPRTTDVHGRAARAAGDPLPARTGPTPLIGIETPPERPVRAARAARLRAARRRGRRPDLARPRRDARGRRDRGDRALPARGRPVHAARSAARCSGCSPASSVCAGASRTRSSASASPRRTRRACGPTTRRRGSCPSRSRSS